MTVEDEERQITPGEIIDGKYRIVRLLGEGGMGAVYEGENLRIRRKVAIKVLHPSVSTQLEVVKRFEREAQAAALVGSEHICEVLDLGVLAGSAHYMVMEYLDGETLSGRITRHGRLTPAQSIPLLLQVLEALAAAHSAGIIHRDLKPDNIFILPQRSGMRDFVKILDFGVSKFSQLSPGEMSVTHVGAVVGTPYYMSPEQARGTTAVDARTDIYAIGVLLYQATTGQVPYEAETFNELLFKIVLEVAPPPQTYVPNLDPEFAGIIMRAMARDPAQRFQNCNEFRDALLTYQASRAVYAPSGPPPARASSPYASQPSIPAPNTGNNWGSASGTAPPNSAPGWAAAPTMRASMSATPVPTATSNAWGHASGAVTIPKSKAPVVFGIIAAVTVLGSAAVAAFLLLGKPSTGTAGQAGTTPTAVASVAATAAPTAVVTAATTATEVVPTAVMTAPAPTETPAADTAAPVVGKPTPVTRPGRLGGRPTPSGKPSASKPQTKPGNDLGY